MMAGLSRITKLKNKKIMYACVVIVTIMLYVIVRNKIVVYWVSKDDPFFDKEEVAASFHKPNKKERQVGQELVDLELECFEENKTDYRLGPLNDYFGGKSEKKIINVSFDTCKIKGNKGIIWVSYDKYDIDKKNLSVEFYSGGPMVWKIEKQNGEWVVIYMHRILG